MRHRKERRIGEGGSFTVFVSFPERRATSDELREEVTDEAGLRVSQARMDGAYDRYILEEGEYPLQVFIGVKL